MGFLDDLFILSKILVERVEFTDTAGSLELTSTWREQSIFYLKKKITPLLYDFWKWIHGVNPDWDWSILSQIPHPKDKQGAAVKIMSTQHWGWTPRSERLQWSAFNPPEPKEVIWKYLLMILFKQKTSLVTLKGFTRPWLLEKTAPIIRRKLSIVFCFCFFFLKR